MSHPRYNLRLYAKPAYNFWLKLQIKIILKWRTTRGCAPPKGKN